MTREEKKQRALVDLTNKMFEIAGHQVTYEDVKHRKDAWYRDWTMTVEEAVEWQAWGTEYLMKRLRLDREAAALQMGWCNAQWGLMYSNFGEAPVPGKTRIQ